MLRTNEASESHEIGLNLIIILHEAGEQASVKNSTFYVVSLIRVISLQVITQLIIK